MAVGTHQQAPKAPRAAERGVALLVVLFVLVAVLVGGLAAVSLTSGELEGAHAFRNRQVVRPCAEVAVLRARALLSDGSSYDHVNQQEMSGEISVGPKLSYRPGHYDGALVLRDVTEETELSSQFVGENVTNRGLGGGGAAGGMKIFTGTGVCEGQGHPMQEMQIIFRHGLPSLGE